MESINDGDVVIVDHDLENQETQITDTPGKYSCGKFIIQSSFKVLAHHQRYNKNNYGIDEIALKTLLFFAIVFL
jgi:hypothetical protein